jgi:hypothetical protein
MKKANRVAEWALYSICLIGIAAHSQGVSQVALLFQQLQEPTTTDRAKADLIALTKSDPSARTYLADHLSPFIEKGPSEPEEPWSNAIRLAGDLRIAEAAPALARWIKLSNGGSTTMASQARLDNYPAAKALAAIGDPAIPTLVGVLGQGNLNERGIAVRALRLIHSTKARNALEAQLNRDPDANMRDHIQRILSDWGSEQP